MSEQQAIKEALLYTMDEFHKVCEKHNLSYYLIGGGLIGAIRHHGFIPWDDDIDVSMPYEDYKKFLKLEDSFSSPLRLSHPSLVRDDYRSTASVINSNIVVDTGAFERNFTGATLDVLCFYPTFASVFMQKLHFKLVKFFRALLIIKGGLYPRDTHGRNTEKLLRLSSLSFRIIPKKVLLLLLNWAEGLAPRSSQYVANLHGAWGQKEVVHVSKLQNRKLYKFENREYWSMNPASADAWLSRIYGDYMQLPPEHEREYRHIAKVLEVSHD